MLKSKSVKEQILRGGISSVLIKILQTIIAFLLAISLARNLGPEGYGIYSYVLAIVTIMAIPCQLGLPQLVVRETAKAQLNKDWATLRGLWRWSSIAVWIASSLVALIVLIYIYVSRSSINGMLKETLLVGLALVPILSLAGLRGAALKGLRHVVLGQLPESIIRPVIFIIGIWGCAFLLNKITPSYAMSIHLLSASASFVLGAIFLWRVKPREASQNIVNDYYPRQWISAAIPLALIASIQLVNNQADIIILGLLTTPEEVGIYKVVVSVSALVAFGLQAINIVVAPHFVRLYNNGDMLQLQSLVTMTTRVILLLALPVVITAYIVGSWVLEVVFGVEYLLGYWPLIILSFGQLLNACFGAVAFLLSMTGYEKEALRSVVVATFLNIILNILLIPHYGMIGAATATSLTLLLSNSLMWIAVKRCLKINTLPIIIK